MKKYVPKALIDGNQFGLPDGTFVAVPDKLAKESIEVSYGGVSMVIKDWKSEAVMFRRFRDKFWTAGGNRPQYYTLGYFKFGDVND